MLVLKGLSVVITYINWANWSVIDIVMIMFILILWLLFDRHGESTWNQENKFTGWYDCPLSDKGHKEAQAAGALLKAEGFQFDIAYTSYLQRAIRTLWYVKMLYKPLPLTYCFIYTYYAYYTALY